MSAKKSQTNDETTRAEAPLEAAPGGESARDDAAPAESPAAWGDATFREQLEAARAERDELRDKWLRSEAELDNYRKRAQREADEQRRYQSLPLVRDLLPGLDNLRRAIEAAESTGNVAELAAGVRLVLKQFEDALSRQGVVPIDAAGQPFDPNQHEALQQVPSAEHAPMTVIEEFQRGYTLHERVVRPSQVVVSSGPPAGTLETSPDGQ